MSEINLIVWMLILLGYSFPAGVFQRQGGWHWSHLLTVWLPLLAAFFSQTVPFANNDTLFWALFAYGVAFFWFWWFRSARTAPAAKTPAKPASPPKPLSPTMTLPPAPWDGQRPSAHPTPLEAQTSAKAIAKDEAKMVVKAEAPASRHTLPSLMAKKASPEPTGKHPAAPDHLYRQNVHQEDTSIKEVFAQKNDMFAPEMPQSLATSVPSFEPGPVRPALPEGPFTQVATLFDSEYGRMLLENLNKSLKNPEAKGIEFEKEEDTLKVRVTYHRYASSTWVVLPKNSNEMG